jgi:hypothetical protein
VQLLKSRDVVPDNVVPGELASLGNVSLKVRDTLLRSARARRDFRVVVEEKHLFSTRRSRWSDRDAVKGVEFGEESIGLDVEDEYVVRELC